MASWEIRSNGHVDGQLSSSSTLNNYLFKILNNYLLKANQCTIIFQALSWRNKEACSQLYHYYNCNGEEETQMIDRATKRWILSSGGKMVQGFQGWQGIGGLVSVSNQPQPLFCYGLHLCFPQ